MPLSLLQMLMVFTLLPSFRSQGPMLTASLGSWTYKHATGNHIHGTTGDSPIAEDAEFMLASQTKLLTTIVVLQAVENGLITLDESVDEKIPELAKQGILKGFDGEGKPMLEEKKNALTLR